MSLKNLKIHLQDANGKALCNNPHNTRALKATSNENEFNCGNCRAVLAKTKKAATN